MVILSMTYKKRFEEFRIKKCRICGYNDLFEFLSLGSMPIPNGFLSEDELQKPEPFYPLGVYVCEKCWLVQLTHVIPAEIMFKNYLYIPSTSSTMLSHFKSLVDEEVENFNLTSKNLVIDIGSNDGTLLGYFNNHEVRTLGVDPANNLAQVARLKGINTLNDFFTEKLAKEILKKYNKAKIITATNVMAHIDNLNDFVLGVSLLLTKDGTLIIEFPYLVDLLEKNEFDTIYHEHLSYFSMNPLLNLFRKHKMYVYNIKKLPIHGGSVRVYVAKKGSKYQVQQIVQDFIKEEVLKKLDKRTTYEDFSRRVKVIRRDLRAFLKKIKSQGKRVVGYGASAKGNVLLNYCLLGTNTIDYIVDSIFYKQGRFTPGTHIPIYPETRLEKNTPHFALLLAWNFADEIIRKQTRYRERGGQFIITIPYLRIE